MYIKMVLDEKTLIEYYVFIIKAGNILWQMKEQ